VSGSFEKWRSMPISPEDAIITTQDVDAAYRVAEDLIATNRTTSH